MSLDYALVRTLFSATHVEDIQQDSSYGPTEYRDLAKLIFPTVEWQSDGSALVQAGDVHIELRMSDACLSFYCRGSGNIFGFMQHVAALVREKGVAL